MPVKKFLIVSKIMSLLDLNLDWSWQSRPPGLVSSPIIILNKKELPIQAGVQKRRLQQANDVLITNVSLVHNYTACRNSSIS